MSIRNVFILFLYSFFTAANLFMFAKYESKAASFLCLWAALFSAALMLKYILDS